MITLLGFVISVNTVPRSHINIAKPPQILKTFKSLSNYIFVALSDHCNKGNCTQKGCQKDDQHCNHCSSIHAFLIESQESMSFPIQNKKAWLYSFLYRPPTMDQALRPPKHSLNS